ncbi:MAG: EI24 domain-containing protein [Deltaproteobacteria bacterium]|nr:EI24 domain-containing protein [Deltaproteobacteria bacterium]
MNEPATSRPLPDGVVSQIVVGARYHFAALAFVRRHRLWGLTAVPTVVNVVLFLILLTVSLYVAVPWLQGAAAALTPAVGDGVWHAIVSGLAKAAVWALYLVVPVLIVVVNAVVLVFLGQAVASPFLDLLSERVECLVLGIEPAPTSAARIVRSVTVAVADVIWSLLFWLAVNVPLALLNLVPLAGSAVAAVLGFCFAALLLTVEFAGLPLTRYFISVPGRWQAVWKNRWLGLGFGTATMALLFVPGLNLMLLPIASVAGTLMYCDLRRSGRLGVSLAALPVRSPQP